MVNNRLPRRLANTMPHLCRASQLLNRRSELLRAVREKNILSVMNSKSFGTQSGRYHRQARGHGIENFQTGAATNLQGHNKNDC